MTKNRSLEADGNFIHLKLTDIPDSLEKEGYLLTITPDTITLKAATVKGLFYAAQTLRQLLLFGHQKENRYSILPSLIIRDKLHYQWRSLMLDPARVSFYPEAWSSLLPIGKMSLRKSEKPKEIYRNGEGQSPHPATKLPHEEIA